VVLLVRGRDEPLCVCTVGTKEADSSSAPSAITARSAFSRCTAAAWFEARFRCHFDSGSPPKYSFWSIHMPSIGRGCGLIDPLTVQIQ